MRSLNVVACVALVVMALHFRFDEDSNRMVPGVSSSRPRSRSASGEDSDLASPGFLEEMEKMQAMHDTMEKAHMV